MATIVATFVTNNKGFHMKLKIFKTLLSSSSCCCERLEELEDQSLEAIIANL
jgi:hypothetical protein